MALGVIPASTLGARPNAAKVFTPVLYLIVISEPGTYVYLVKVWGGHHETGPREGVARHTGSPMYRGGI